MNVVMTDEEAAELESVVGLALRDMSHEIAATEHPEFRARLVARRDLLRSAEAALTTPPDRPRTADQLSLVSEPSEPLEPAKPDGWMVQIAFTEDEDRTRADARLNVSGGSWHGWGRARRNPMDPDVPAIGEELAAARALADLSHQLVEAAAHGVEAFEHQTVRLHV
jgi:Rv2632c-like